MNTYASVPTDIKGRVREAATKALENDIRATIIVLEKFGDAKTNEAVIAILCSLIGEAE